MDYSSWTESATRNRPESGRVVGLLSMSARQGSLLASCDAPAGGLDEPVALVTRLGGGAGAEDVRPTVCCGEVVPLVDVPVEQREPLAGDQRQERRGIDEAVQQPVRLPQLAERRVMDDHQHRPALQLGAADQRREGGPR